MKIAHTPGSRSSVGANVLDDVFKGVRARTGRAVRAHVGDPVMAAVRKEVMAPVGQVVGGSAWNRFTFRRLLNGDVTYDGVLRASVCARINEQVRIRLMGMVDATVKSSFGEQVWASIYLSIWPSAILGAWESLRGLWEQHSCAFLLFFNDAFEENDFRYFAHFNELVHGYSLGDQEAWLVRKASRLERDEQGRLHSDTGMCVQYRDGWGLYAWHGVNVTERIIMRPETITREAWMQVHNIERRRILQERLGAERFLALVGGRTIQHTTRGELLEVDLGNDPEEVARFVHVKDASTDREYYLRVPPNIQSVDEAVAWTFGLTTVEYQPAKET